MVKKTKRLRILCLMMIVALIVGSLFSVAAFADESDVQDFPLDSSLELSRVGELAFSSGDIPLFDFELGTYRVFINQDEYILTFSFDEENSFNDCSVFSAISDYFKFDVIITNLYCELAVYLLGDVYFDLDTLVVSSDYQEPSAFDSILSLFRAIGEWFSTSFSSLISVFWLNGELTFLGMLAVVPLAFSVIFLIIGILQNFLRFGG